MKSKSAVSGLAREIAQSAADLKAMDIRVLDLRKLCSFTDFFVICSGSSDRHVQSVANRILEDQKASGNNVLGMEGYGSAKWVLMDYGSVVVHVFYPETRLFYNIEKFWGDAPRVKIINVTD